MPRSPLREDFPCGAQSDGQEHFFLLLHKHLVPKSSLCLGQIESSLWLSSTWNIPEKAKSFTCSFRMIEIQSKTNKQTKQTNTHTHKQKHKTTKQTNEISYHGNLVWCRGCAIQCEDKHSHAHGLPVRNAITKGCEMKLTVNGFYRVCLPISHFF